MMHRAVVIGIAVLVSANGAARAADILAANATATSPTLRAFSEVELEVYYSATTTRVTGMRFWFPTGLTGTTSGTFRDGDASSTGVVAGNFVRNDGAFDVYEFGFGSALNPRSLFYAGYGFLNSGTAVNIGTSTTATISFDSGLVSNVYYSSVNPDPTDPGSPTYQQYPRFELVGVPEPVTLRLAVMAAGALGCGRAWRRLAGRERRQRSGPAPSEES